MHFLIEVSTNYITQTLKKQQKGSQLNIVSAKELVGKVIVGVDDTCTNTLVIETHTGETFTIWVDSETYGFPYYEIEKKELK